MKIKLLKELNPSPRTLKAISSTHPYKIQITSGKINILKPMYLSIENWSTFQLKIGPLFFDGKVTKNKVRF